MADRPPITTHILDLVRGRPAAAVAVRLYGPDGHLADGVTNADGRVETRSFLAQHRPRPYFRQFP